MSNSYGVQNVPEDAAWGWYDSNNDEWIGQWFSSKEFAQDEVNSEYATGNIGSDGIDEDGLMMVSTSNMLDYISPTN